MAAEASRKVSYRKVTAQTNAGGSWATLPGINFYPSVIDEITFLDRQEGWQEYIHTYDNTRANKKRGVREVAVYDSTDTSPAPSIRILTEYVLSADMYDRQDAGREETIWSLTNNSSSKTPVHLKYHDFILYNREDDGTKGTSWIKIRRIDQIIYRDLQDNWQDTVFTLNWPDDENSLAWPIHPDTSDDGTTINPPWRLDPFQQIIDHGIAGLAVLFYDGTS